MSTFAAAAMHLKFVCRRTDTILAAIEKCLDNGMEMCLVVGDDNRLLGQITLTDIRQSILDGRAQADMTLEGLISDIVPRMAMITGENRNNTDDDDNVLTPILDYKGRLISVDVDRRRKMVQVAKPDLSRFEFRAVLDAFLSSWISSKGAYIQQLERDFATFTNTAHGVAVSNGTTALHLSLVALGVGPGDEVIVPDLTFVATINVVLHCRATPVIVDVDPTTWTMSASAVEAAITPRTKAIIPVHLYGRPAEIGPIVDVARKHGVYVIEDCAEAHGAQYDGRPVGQFGDISCFSFYANKIVTTGEGGMCVTSSPELALKLTTLRDHGMSPSQCYWYDNVGYNYRMTNLQAAIGCMQLQRVDEMLERNTYLDQLYREYLADVPGVEFPPPLDETYKPIIWLVSARVPQKHRDNLILAARDADIEIRPFFPSLSALPIYDKFSASCPASSALSLSGVNLPTSSAVDRGAVEKIAGVVREVLA
ncbi:MAG TPA: aminotransferase class I/II-fold pyridoxal phosphate-dependent enzyme [Magnetospirillaceae bacterium]|jgi:perosamine synthetase